MAEHGYRRNSRGNVANGGAAIRRQRRRLSFEENFIDDQA
jgi:hypothetical protein